MLAIIFGILSVAALATSSFAAWALPRFHSYYAIYGCDPDYRPFYVLGTIAIILAIFNL